MCLFNDVTKNKKTIFGILLISLGLGYSSLTSAKQTVLLDANGIPLSDEVLLLLSNTSGKLNKNKIQVDKKSNKDSKKPGKKKKTNSRSYPKIEAELFEALEAGKIARAKHLLKIGAAPVYKNYKGVTPLGLAVTRGWASMVIELIENGANIHEKGARGVTLLHIASSRGLIDVAKVLVKHGLDTGKKTDKNWTPLHIAARYGHWKLVQYFLTEGVDPNIRNSDGQTALGLARHLRHQGIIKILSRVTTKRSLDFASLKSAKKKRKKSRRKKRK